jgi:RNA polymerase sigma factor for flagellar operon FliA
VEARVRAGMDLVAPIAAQLRSKARRSSVAAEDVTSYGNEGLLVAARTFDPSRGVPFRSWATIKIRGAMLDGIRSTGAVPRRLLREIRAIEAADRVLEARVEEDAARPADGAESADARLQTYLADMATAMALAMASGKADVAEEVPTPEDRAAASEAAAVMRAAVGRLPDSEKALVESHYFGDATLEEAARQLGLSKSWGSRLHARAIEALTRDMKRNRISE